MTGPSKLGQHDVIHRKAWIHFCFVASKVMKTSIPNNMVQEDEKHVYVGRTVVCLMNEVSITGLIS